MKVPAGMSEQSVQLSHNASPNLSRALIAATILGGASISCASVQNSLASPGIHEAAYADGQENSKCNVFVTPLMDASTTNYDTSLMPIDHGSRDSKDEPAPATDDVPVIEVPNITVVAKAPRGPWPKLPENCTYTGIVLEHDISEQPHNIVLENMCYRNVGKSRYTDAGYHITVQADDRGRYELPYYDTHLEERGDQIFLVVENRDNIVKVLLGPGQYAPDTLSFEYELDTYGIREKR